MQIQLGLSSYPSSDPLTRCRSLSVSFDLGLRISSYDMSSSHTIRVTTPEAALIRQLLTIPLAHPSVSMAKISLQIQLLRKEYLP